ncbi:MULTISPECIES: pyridoxamine 5'-phosphate oxidase family protein [unclassified Streptomyces]|uniref:pyridoxamine 5'-phosphate oxidase family protein n=1 Tax=unclassified Streptomyces TaxID=2593676 RepID=UPI003807C8BB
MSTPERRIIEVSGAEALWLLKGSVGGRLIHTRGEVAIVRPATHILEYGRLIVRSPAPVAAFAEPVTVTYQTDQVSVSAGRGWSVTATGPAEVIREPEQVAHYRRTLAGWIHGPHDTLIRVHPHAVQGHRLGIPAPSSAVTSGKDRPGLR